MGALARVIDQINEWQGRIFSGLLIIATLQVCYELVMRYFFNAPTTWGLEMTIYLCSATYVMAGAYAHKHNAHLKVDLLHGRLSKRTMARIDVFVSQPIFFFFALVLVWQSGAWTLESVERGTTSGTLWDPPIWPMRLSVFVAACLLLLQGVANLTRDLLDAFARRQPK
ncbi:MAG: TRAP transporter small permease subunit [Deferrisomatales bacterium]